MSITDVHADGTTTVFEMPQAPADVAVDCFYLYPTLDAGLFAPPRNLDFDQIDREAVRQIFFTQALAFRQICSMWAPIYRQASLLSFEDADAREMGLETAYRDVEAAFDYYLQHAGSRRPIVFVTHSQGAILTGRLLARRFEGHPELMKRLVVAMLGGPLGGFDVPTGEVVGGTLKEIPLCTSDAQTGCALTWDTFAATNPPGTAYLSQNGGQKAGFDVGCTAPPGGIGTSVRLGGALFYQITGSLALLAPRYDYGSVKVSTPFARYSDFYTARCSQSSIGATYLSLSAAPLPDDVRVDPVPYDNVALSDSSTGLHLLDYTFVSDDLIRAARTKIAAFGE